MKIFLVTTTGWDATGIYWVKTMDAIKVLLYIGLTQRMVWMKMTFMARVKKTCYIYIWIVKTFIQDWSKYFRSCGQQTSVQYSSAAVAPEQPKVNTKGVAAAVVVSSLSTLYALGPFPNTIPAHFLEHCRLVLLNRTLCRDKNALFLYCPKHLLQITCVC